MDKIGISDNNQKIIMANDDLRAIRSVILTVGDHEEDANAYEVLKVIDRSLDSIIGDMQEAINSIDRILMEAEKNDKGKDVVRYSQTSEG